MSAAAFDVLTDFGTLEEAARRVRGGVLLPEDETAIFNVQNHLIYGTFRAEERPPFEFEIAAEAVKSVYRGSTSALDDVRFLCIVEQFINL